MHARAYYAIKFNRNVLPPEGGILAEVLAEGVLLHVKGGTLPAQAGHLTGLQRCHLLLHGHRLLLHIQPLLWQLLQRHRKRLMTDSWVDRWAVRGHRFE